MEEDKKTIGNEYSLRQYECGYCGYEFKQFVRTVMKNTPTGSNPEASASTQVQCPYCKAFLKTWDEGKDLGIYKGKPKQRQYAMDEKIK